MKTLQRITFFFPLPELGQLPECFPARSNHPSCLCGRWGCASKRPEPCPLIVSLSSCWIAFASGTQSSLQVETKKNKMIVTLKAVRRSSAPPNRPISFSLAYKVTTSMLLMELAVQSHFLDLFSDKCGNCLSWANKSIMLFGDHII